jgi:enoyl-CoA hydratase/carnithine racemase
LTQAQAVPGVAAICVTGKPFIFAVGADLTGVPRLTDRGQALAIGKLGHEVLGMLGASSVPTFAFVNGAAMGGGVEVACTASTGRSRRVRPRSRCPEVFLGLIPGWGGAYLLPNLIGPRRPARSSSRTRWRRTGS